MFTENILHHGTCSFVNVMTKIETEDISYYKTTSAKHSPSWEPDCSVGQKITAFYGNQKVHDRVHRNPPLKPILSHMNPVHTLVSHFFEIHFNIILPSTLRSHKLSLPFRFFA
jgi:hypothetical protein